MLFFLQTVITTTVKASLLRNYYTKKNIQIICHLPLIKVSASNKQLQVWNITPLLFPPPHWKSHSYNDSQH